MKPIRAVLPRLAADWDVKDHEHGVLFNGLRYIGDWFVFNAYYPAHAKQTITLTSDEQYMLFGVVGICDALTPEEKETEQSE